ncbi:MAG: hypothetical protein ACRDF4_04485, partial [Rhabdochlamydiaceae bacterium]
MIQRICDQKIGLVPIIPRTKNPPFGFPLSAYYERTKPPLTLQELAGYASKNFGFAAIAGINSLVGIDVESEQDYLRLWDCKIAESLPNLTVVVKTSRGYCAWFIDPEADFANLKSAISMQAAINGEIIMHNHLMNCPGNIHPSGFVYRLVGTDKIALRPGIVDQMIQRLKSLGWIGDPLYFKTALSDEIIEGELTEHLSETEKGRIVKQLLPCWQIGYRNKLILATCGLLI